MTMMMGKSGQRKCVAGTYAEPILRRSVISTSRYNSDEIYDVHKILKEDDMIRTGSEAKRELRRKPDNTNGLYYKEWLVSTDPVVNFTGAAWKQSDVVCGCDY